VCVCMSICLSFRGERWRRNKHTSDFDAWTQESEVNLVVTGLGLRKYYIELREN